MQKALKILGIVFGIILAIGAVSMYISGSVVVGTAEEVIKQLQTEKGYNAQMAQSAVTLLTPIFFVAAVVITIGCVLSFVAVHFAKKEEPSKASLIALGVLNIIFGNEIVGIVAIIDGAVNGK